MPIPNGYFASMTKEERDAHLSYLRSQMMRRYALLFTAKWVVMIALSRYARKLVNSHTDA